MALLGGAPVSSGYANQTFGIQLVHPVFSPNGDGVRDVLQIQLRDVPDKLEEPYNWECEIQTASGVRVRLFRADRRLIRQSAGLGNLFMPGDEDVRPVQLFERLVWDGRNEKGHRIADGYYKAVVRIYPQSHGGAYKAEANTIRVDTTAPIIELRPVRSLLVLPGGRSDPGRGLELIQKLKSAELGTRFLARLYSIQGKLLSTRVWESQLPSRVLIRWDEIKQSSEPFSRYRYELLAEDAAGNRTVAEFANLVVSDFRPQAALMPNRTHISPNGDGLGDVVAFQLGQYSSNGLFSKNRSASRWEFEILNAGRSARIFHRQANGVAPATLIWDGRNYAREYVSNGLYHARLILNGNRYSDPVPIVVNRELLTGKLSISGNSFSPNQDGEDDYLEFELNFPEETHRWKIIIYLTPEIHKNEGAAVPFRRIYRIYQGGPGKERKFVWDGKSDDGYEAQSLERFTFIYELEDRAGNHSVGEADPVETDLFFRPNYKGGRNLVARIPLQNYFNEENKLKPDGLNVLGRIRSRLRRYGLYKYSIEVHASAPGREEINLDRTEQRAMAIRQYLHGFDLKGEYVDYRGFGETELLRLHRENFDHYRNERIEVRLIEGR